MKLARTFHWKWPLIGLLWAGLAAPAGATEFAVPNAGSPYVSLDQLENDQILHLETGVRVTLEEMMDIVSSSRVIYVGETHDNLEAHRAQLEVLQRLYARYPGRVAVGMEMFRRSAQKELNRWVRGNLPETRFRTLFRENWGGGYRFYQSLFQFMQDKAIPLLGLKSSKPTETAFRKGDPAPEGVTFPELNEDDPFHKAYSMAIFGGHETHSKHLEKPYRMLLLWEETMAQTVGEFLQD
ncbi:MAG: hypothetical protein GWM98_22860, partial [Nitrospinaceae bacterium]|nr:ChaN family lipoprotein [Nitrospinaceae bacterium]NIR56776.1 ChaN family lipoprotein [Nitrospinaceae bacterium]NIS87230.1 ChaN family lipoprotein [Nitrospinaceae bacterium]NIT84097.1 ChaN family lipoprotein [Nitrospinaceae bacterium]NIU46276.1 ChaN family lipoprotein [Nitrospinaceae bacterium]